MCGIAGVLELGDAGPPDPRRLGRMAAALRHRGPDSRGLYRDRHAGLVHARLAIVDLATGQQPLSSPDGRLWTVFNGEIFNYVELRDELVRGGRRFHTTSDTEVLVQAWEEWGEAALERFNGQFAFALWDREARRLVLARDRVGICPLFYAWTSGRLLFASEAKAIFADPGIPREIDPEGLDQVFHFWTTVAPITAFRGIAELEPATVLTVTLDREAWPAVRKRRYWEPRFPAGGGATALSIEDAATALLERLERATALRALRADVPVGAYLSGGIDSSATAILARRVNPGRFHTFSLRFEDAEFDEGPYQKTLVAALGSEHTEVECARRDIARLFPEVVFHAERPLLRAGAAPLFLLSRLVRDAGFKVVLTGEGSDEVLAGYDLFREAKVRAFWARQPGSVRRPLLLRRLYPYLARSPAAAESMARRFFAQGLDRVDDPGFSHRPRWTAAAALRRLFSPAVREATAGIDAASRLLEDLPASFASWDLLARAQYLEMRTLLSGYLLGPQGDRMLMAHSIEGRFPFLDPELIEFANALPSDYKLRVLDEKHLLKRALAGVLPAAILRRPKQPYRTPDAASFTGPDAPDYVDELLGQARLREAQLFDPPSVERLVGKCRAAASGRPLSNSDNMALLGVLSTQLLWERLVHTPPATVTEERPAFSTWIDRVDGAETPPPGRT